MWIVRREGHTWDYCPVCGYVQTHNAEGQSTEVHAFSHSLPEWQTVYDAEDFVTNFLGEDEFYRKYRIYEIETRKILLRVARGKGIDLRGKEASNTGSVETANALLTLARRVLDVNYIPDFTDRSKYEREYSKRMRARHRARMQRKADHTRQVTDGILTLEIERHQYADRHVQERGLIRKDGLKIGDFNLQVPYRKKFAIKLVAERGYYYPSKVRILEFNIHPEFRGKGFGRTSYRMLERELVEKYNPDEIQLHPATWTPDPTPFWQKMGYSITGRSEGLDKMHKIFREYTNPKRYEDDEFWD